MTSRPQTETVDIPLEIEFRDPVAAARNLSRLQPRLGAETFQSLLYVLLDSPDPDSAVVLLDRLLEKVPRESADSLSHNPNLLHYACAVFAHSNWLGEALVRNPGQLRRIDDRMDVGRSWSCEEFREELARFQVRSGTGDPSQLLARFRKREYVRILLRDVLQIAKIGEVTEEISALSDALLERAILDVHAQLAQRYGSPRWVDPKGRHRDSRFSLVSLGKLGGNELNYSSDVDLMLLFDGGVAPAGAKISNREYFIELAQKTVELLSRRTPEGQVFRIDLRLRPQGHEGELAVALPRALQYYSEVAQDWELQAMIKARHSAGDTSLTSEFIRGIAPFVYRPNLNFAAIKTALQSRERIDRRGANPSRLHATARAIDVKLDRGGIRDIEFLVQCLQRVYGGEEPWLRSRGTLFALQKLHDKQHLTGKDFNNLSKAYEFLRDIEHHLQLRQGRQGHRLPASGEELRVLAKCVNRAEDSIGSAEEFTTQVRSRMTAVAEIYRRIVYREQDAESADANRESSLQRVFPATAEDSYSKIMDRLATDAPDLLAQITRVPATPHARRNLDRFFNSAATNPERYSAVLRAADSIGLALRIFECSEYLSDILIRHPTDLAVLQESSERPPTSTGNRFALSTQPEVDTPHPAPTTRTLSALELQQAQVTLRRRFRRTMLAANARDFFHQPVIWEVMDVNSTAGDQAIAGALAIVGTPPGFAILALGRLGSREFDVLSDADLLFVADDAADYSECRRTAERVMQFLTAYTREGTVFPVDARLRPHGVEGELVTTPGRLLAYFASEAKPWEAISYLRLRLVAGSREMGERVLRLLRGASLAIAQRDDFAAELQGMRQRLEASDADPNFKTGLGGTYDIDFLVGCLQARHALWCNGNLAARINLLRQNSLLDANDARELSANAAFLRRLEHHVRLVTGRPYKWLPPGDHARSVLHNLISSRPEQTPVSDLDVTLAVLLRRNREIFLKYPF